MNHPYDKESVGRPRARALGKVPPHMRKETPRPERTRGEDAPQKKRGARGVFLSLACLLAAALFLLYAGAVRNASVQRLDALRRERAEAKQKHEEQLQYYAGLRAKSGVLPAVKKYAAEHGVEEAMISAIIARESHYDAYAESRVGARGLMQLMEDSGQWIAKKLGVEGYAYDHLFDPDLNIRFGSWYLAYLSDIFGGDPVMVAAAYHAGANNVSLWALKHADDKKHLKIEQIPKDDTKDYVEKVMRAYALYWEYDAKNP